MTSPTIDSPRAASLPPLLSYGPPRLLAGATRSERADAARHLATHGPLVLRDRAWLTAASRDVALLGRGGAGFPVHRKLEALPDGGVEVVANGSEGEPASWKDRTLMRQAPHLVIDGVVLVGRALGAARASVAVHDAAAAASLRAAVAERSDAAHVDVVRTTGGFVSGEVRAVLGGLSGAPAVPDGLRTLPTVSGLHRRPTFASNVETFAQLALLARLGASFADVGSAGEPGTTLLTVIGDVPHPGVVEVPTGMPLAALLQSTPDDPRPVLVGGYHGTWVRDVSHLAVERPALRAADVPLNAGVVARLPRGACGVVEVLAVADWLASESAGQCGPCYFGLPAVAHDLRRVTLGEARVDDLRRHLGDVRGRGACAHPDGTARFVRTAVETMLDEVVEHATRGRCTGTAAHALPLPRAAA